jgi:plasmid replication initiation protein
MSDSTECSLKIRQSNDLVNSSYHLSVAEMRLVFHLISRISPDDKEFLSYEFSAAELGQMMRDRTLTYPEAEAITLRLWRREIHIQEGDWKGSYRWVINAERNKQTGLIRVSLDPKLKPFLLNLYQWTQARMEQICSLSSGYAVRIYLWASKVRNQSQRTWEISIDELRGKLEIPVEEYVRFSSLNQRVLREPIEEINTHTDLKLSYQVLRKGRTPYAIRFTIIDGKPTATGTGELVHAEKIKRIKQKKCAVSRRKPNDLNLLSEPKEISEEERAAALEQIRHAKQVISKLKPYAN